MDPQPQMTSDLEPRQTPTRSGFVASARVVAGLTLLSRVFGLARDVVCSRVFGAGPVWSAFALAFLIPNLFRRLFGEGALAAAFIPQYAQLHEQDVTEADRLASATVTMVLAGLLVLTGLIELGLWYTLSALDLSDSGALAIRLAMIMLPFMPLVCMTALLGGMLQTHGRFAPTAAAPIVLNICMIGAALIWGMAPDVDLQLAAGRVGVAVVVAGLLQVAWALHALHGSVRWTTQLRGAGASVQKLLRQMGPVLIGLGALQINQLLDGLIASWPLLVGPDFWIPGRGVVAYPLDESSNAVLFFAQRLYHFPLGVFGIALATAAFPMLARQTIDREAFRGTLSRGVRLSLFIGVPASVGLAIVREPLAGAAFLGGRFETADLERVSNVLLGYAPAIWAYMLTHFLTRAFYALGDMRTPMRVSIAFVIVNTALNLILIWWLREAGLAWSTSICAIAQCLILARILRSRHQVAPAGDVRGLALWTITTSGLMAGILIVIDLLAGRATDPGAWSGRLVVLLALVAAGGLIYGGAAHVTRRPELGWLMERQPKDEA